jgi:two-component system nitrate/nitrite sensor histidine kinase NarX
MEVLKGMDHQMGIANDNALLLAHVYDQQDEIGLLADRISELEAALAQSRVEADDWRKRLDTLLLISETMNDPLFIEQVFQKIADILLEITGFSMLGVKLYDDQTQRYCLVAHRGMPPEVIPKIRTNPADRGDFLTIVARTLQPVFTSEHASDPRAAEKCISQVGIRSVAFVPLLAADQFLGVFTLSSKEEVLWNEANIQWLASIGRQIGVIIHNVQLAEQIRVSAVLEERARLGQEMHDGLAQALAYLNLQTTITNELLSSNQVGLAQAKLIEIKEIANETYQDVREAIFSLRTTVWPGLGLLSTLREYLAEYRTYYGVDAQLVVEDKSLTQFPADVGIQIIRIVKEALTNVRKHAGASKVWVRFEGDGDGARITVEDDGRGFDPAQVAGKGRPYFGLQIMRERAESVGGSLDLNSRPGKGTRVTIHVPPLPQE